MSIKTLAVAGIFMLASATASFAATQAGVDFRGFVWGTSDKTIQAQDKGAASGKFSMPPNGGILRTFAGTYDKKPAQVSYEFDIDHELVGGLIKFKTDATRQEAEKEFELLNADFTKKFGKPTVTVGEENAYIRASWKTEHVDIVHVVSSGGRIKSSRMLKFSAPVI